jgi:hypothetical protein
MYRAATVLGLLWVALATACGGEESQGGLEESLPDAEPMVMLEPEPQAPPQTSYDFIVTEMNFYFPPGLEPAQERVENPCGLDGNTDNSLYNPLVVDGLVVDGFDLDGTDGADELCPHSDFLGLNGESGVDFGFLRVMDMIRPARPGQTIQTVLSSAPSQGLIRVGIRITGVDDFVNDDDVEVMVTTTQDTPLLGTDGRIVPLSSVAADSDPAFQSVLKGSIVDGVLTAGPADVAVGKVDLLVIQDRVVSLKDAVIRATMTELSEGVFEVDSMLGGWWVRDEMEEAISDAILTIGANRGELDCVLDNYMDHSTDGVTCDAMSMIFKVKAVSGFITGLDGQE